MEYVPSAVNDFKDIRLPALSKPTSNGLDIYETKHILLGIPDSMTQIKPALFQPS